ncbi:chitinase N-terminal domain-containing protein, partial [Paenibacillus sp. MCAF20]
SYAGLARLTLAFAGQSEAPNADEIGHQMALRLESAEEAASEHQGAKVRHELQQYIQQANTHTAQVFTAEQANVLEKWALWFSQSTPLASGAPGKPVLSDDNGYDTGLKDGDFTVTMNLWWGNNGTDFKLYENGELIELAQLTDNSPSAQSFKSHISNKANGTYVYTCELINSYGSTACAPYTVIVEDASPGKPVLSHNNWDGDGEFQIEMNMWWGTNATEYELYENGALVDSQMLVSQTPRAQSAMSALSGRTPGTYEYVAILRNEAGETASSKMTVVVQR